MFTVKIIESSTDTIYVDGQRKYEGRIEGRKVIYV